MPVIPSFTVRACARALWSDAAPAYRLARMTPTLTIDTCVCCGDAPAPDDTSAAPYCRACRAHAERSLTRRLAAALGSGLAGCATAVALPLMWPAASLPMTVAIALGVAGLPLLVELLWRVHPGPPHTSCEAALVHVGAEGVVATRRALARALAHASACTLHVVRAPRRKHPWWLLSGALTSALLSMAAHAFFHPVVRVLNLSGRSLEIAVDGKPILTLLPTSVESPLAGAELRLPAGQRTLSARASNGSTLVHDAAHIIAGRTHLYAPLSDGQCFWLETTRYGREGTQTKKHPLASGTAFWPLATDIDLWLVPAPVSEPGSWLSGGEVIALRQGPCAPTPGSR